MNIIVSLRKYSKLLSNYHITASGYYSQNSSYSINALNNKEPFLKIDCNRTRMIIKRNLSFSEKLTSICTSLSHSKTVTTFQDAIILFHDNTGLPWWAAIVLYTTIIRIALFPLAIYTSKIRARLDFISMEEMPKISKQLQKELRIAKQTHRLSDEKAKALFALNLKNNHRELIVRDNCHPFKMTLNAWLQMPIWVCQSFALRNIASMQPDSNAYKTIIAFTQLNVGGFLWIPNLLENDISYILPITCAIFHLMNIEKITVEHDKEPSRMMKIVTGLFRVLIIAWIPITASVPSCMSLYWTTSAAGAFLQNMILVSPKAKRLFGIPMNTSYHMEQPYRTMAQRFVQRMKNRMYWCTKLIAYNNKSN